MDYVLNPYDHIYSMGLQTTWGRGCQSDEALHLAGERPAVESK